MRKINLPLLVFALTNVNEDLISLTIWRKTKWNAAGYISFPSGNMLEICGAKNGRQLDESLP